jgi:hypothetical protein
MANRSAKVFSVLTGSVSVSAVAAPNPVKAAVSAKAALRKYVRVDLNVAQYRPSRLGGNTGESLGAEPFEREARPFIAFAGPHSW